MMGGDITVKSELGKGSTFTITYTYKYRLADNTSQENDQSAGVEEIDYSILEGKRILLVEDHPMNAMIATKLLEKQNMIVTTAKDGREALLAFTDHEPDSFDVVLMDMRMPNMGGIEATQLIRAIGRKDTSMIPIIAMTANAFEEDKKETKAAGMNAHLSKSIEPKLLYKTLVELLKQVK